MKGASKDSYASSATYGAAYKVSISISFRHPQQQQQGAEVTTRQVASHVLSRWTQLVHTCAGASRPL